MNLGQLFQRIAEGTEQFAPLHDPDFRRRGREVGNGRGLVGPVHHLHATVVGDDDFTNEPVGFFHQHHVHALAFTADIQTDLGAADTDGGHRGIQGHGVGVGLGDLTGHESEHALQGGQIYGALLSRRVVDHFIENDAAAFAHGESGFVGKQDADGAIVAGFDNVALVDGIAFLQFDAGPVGAHGEHRARQVFDVTDGLAIGAGNNAGISGNRSAIAPRGSGIGAG